MGLRYIRSFGILGLGVDLALSHCYNRDFLKGEDDAHLSVEIVLWPKRRE